MATQQYGYRTLRVWHDSIDLAEQVYRLTAEQLRIPEATAAVHQKLEVLSRSAEALHGHVETRRGVALEVLVVFLITLEIVLAFVRH